MADIETDTTKATVLRRESQRIVDWIASHISDAELKQLFFEVVRRHLKHSINYTKLTGANLMQVTQLFKLSQNPWGNGLRLALINLTLAIFSGGSFLGVLSIISLLNQRMYANGGTSEEIPFPYPLLLVLYAIIFPIAWVLFGQRLPGTQGEKIKVGLVGAGPLFALSFIGYASIVGVFVWNQVMVDLIPIASVFVFGFLSTLILFAGLTCVGFIMWLDRGNKNKFISQTSASIQPNS